MSLYGFTYFIYQIFFYFGVVFLCVDTRRPCFCGNLDFSSVISNFTFSSSYLRLYSLLRVWLQPQEVTAPYWL